MTPRAYRATPDVPADTLRRVSLWVAAHRKTHDVRPWQRRRPRFVQTVEPEAD